MVESKYYQVFQALNIGSIVNDKKMKKYTSTGRAATAMGGCA